LGYIMGKLLKLNLSLKEMLRESVLQGDAFLREPPLVRQTRAYPVSCLPISDDRSYSVRRGPSPYHGVAMGFPWP